MSRRFLIALLELIAVLLLTLVFAGLLQLFFGESPESAFLSAGPLLVFQFMDVGLVVWVLLLVLGAARGRGLGFGVGGGILAALIAAAVNLVVVTVIALIQGGAQLFLVAFGVEAGILFLIAALIAVPLVQRGLRSRP